MVLSIYTNQNSGTKNSIVNVKSCLNFTYQVAVFPLKTVNKIRFRDQYKTIFKLMYAVFNILILTSVTVIQDKPAPIELYPQPLLTLPQFYIVKVEDNRAEQKAVAWIYPTFKPKQKVVLQTVDLKGGGLNCIQNFVWQSFPQNKKLRPVLIHLQECKVTESVTSPGRIEGKAALAVSFDLYNANDPIKLTDYRIDSKYTRTENQLNLPGTIISSSLTAALKYFDNWINKQADHHPKLATKVKVVFKDYHEKTEGDTIYYAVNRPLLWSDFQEKPRGGKFAAMVFPSFGFEEKTEIASGIINIQLEMKVYVPKSACWVKDGYHNDYTLNHEQRHFDVAKIITEQFRQQIQKAKINPDTYEAVINMQYLESYRDMNKMQKAYDTETSHGLNRAAQQNWNKRIDNLLSGKTPPDA
ncbi:MAG: hypothetical protein EOP45_02335 [Sphingobacteriaceae bacterium]|nr:MAG: hypothetical protein EOP45_02335 [Sphingobacteriaceae bacterium]